jgi:hypothetical protein
VFTVAEETEWPTKLRLADDGGDEDELALKYIALVDVVYPFE